MRGVLRLTVWILAALSAVAAGAQEAFTPPVPDGTDEFDWIQLTSGEWLKGEFLRMYRNEVTFDSDELDELTLDWEDVAIVRTARPMALLLRGRGTAEGRLEIDGDRVQVLGDVEISIRRAQVVSITNGSSNEIDHWNAKFSVGANYREGNTEQVEYNGHLNVARYTVRNRITGDYIGNYNTTQQVEQANNHRATMGWDRFVTEKFFVTLLFGEYFRDRFQNIRHRGTLGAGIGYQIADAPKVEWQVAMGPAYQRTRFFDVTETTSEAESTPAWVTSTSSTSRSRGPSTSPTTTASSGPTSCRERTTTTW